LDCEQKEIVCLIERPSKTEKGRRFVWNKFNGNLTCNVMKKYSRRRLKTDLEVVGPAFINGYLTEFDLMVVDAGSKPEEFTNAYKSESIHLVMEVKSHGTHSEKALKRIKDIFEDLTRECLT